MAEHSKFTNLEQISAKHHVLIVMMEGLELEHIDQLERNLFMARDRYRGRDLLLSRFYVRNVRVAHLKSLEDDVLVGIETMKGHHVVHIHQSQKKLVHEVAIQSLGYLSIHRTGPAQKEILVAGVQYHVGGLADDPCAKTILAIGYTLARLPSG